MATKNSKKLVPGIENALREMSLRANRYVRALRAVEARREQREGPRARELAE